jgi:hypothetical protein
MNGAAVFEALLLAANIWTSDVPPLAAHGKYLTLDAPIGLDTWLSPDIWSIPVYTSSRRDSRRPLLYNPDAWSNVAEGRWQRSGNNPKIEQEILATSSTTFPPPGNVFSSTSPQTWTLPATFNKAYLPDTGFASFYASAQDLPAPGPDGHMAVLQPDDTVLETYATITLSSGQIVALSYSVSDLHSAGDGYQNGQTASMLPSYLGVIDDTEVTAGHINHAMAITVPSRFLSPQIAYPAFAFDRNALTESPPYSGSLPMGTRLAIPADTALDSLKLKTSSGRTIAAAAHRYGFIIVDRGGEGITMRIRRNSPKPNDDLHNPTPELQDDLRVIFAHLIAIPH